LADVEWDVPGHNLFDVQAEKLQGQLAAGSLIVRDIGADPGGGFGMDLGNGWSVHLCPASALVREYWRLFYRDENPTADHFVLFPEWRAGTRDIARAP
jgi:hypothetical protein